VKTTLIGRIWKGLEKLKDRHADKYWTLLILMYTGCRIGEVTQLRLDDLEKLGKHWVIHFRHRPELGQTLKAARKKSRTARKV